MIDVSSYSGLGGRSNNEDYFKYNSHAFVLADGLGGHECGEVASKAAVEYLTSYPDEKINIENGLNHIANDVNNHILQIQKENPKLASMRTTVVAAFIQGNKMGYLNVGDSRFYYFKKCELVHQTVDHSVPAMLAQAGRVDPADIRNHEDRNKLLKVLGDSEDLALKGEKQYDTIELEDGDAFLLCSDGFWEYVYETEMEIDLSKSDSAHEWKTYMLKRLLNRVTDNNDNFTLICGILRL